MTPYYQADGLTLYHANCAKVFEEIDLYPIRTVVTCPPWFEFRESQRMSEPSQWTIEADASWVARTMQFYLLWLPGVRWLTRATNSGRVWIYGHTAHVGAILRCAYLMTWETPQIWTTPGSQVAVMLLGEAVSVPDYLAVQDRLAQASNPMEDADLLATILTISGGPVLDPFCGTGRTLLAARGLGMKATGIEIREDACQATVARLGGVPAAA